MNQRILATSAAPAAVGAYNQGKQIGPFLQLSGQLAIDPSTGKISTEGIEEQTKLCLQQVTVLLAEAGGTWDDVLTSRVYLSSDDNFDAFDAAYADIVPKPYPARITVGAELAPGALLEIEVLAVLEDVRLTAAEPVSEK